MIPISRKEELVVQETQDEVLVYDLKSNKAHCLNETSAMVWQYCDGTKTSQQIAAELTGKLGKPVSDDLVWLALDQLKENDLLSFDPPIEPHYQGVSRRDVMKRIGLASAVALPVIFGLVAPVAVHAGSCNGPNAPGCVPDGGPCTRDADCCSCFCSLMMNVCK
jgi:hypothetical protein